MEPLMTLRGVTVAYENKIALDSLDLDIPKNRITAVIGPSGCGKTTLLHSMNGLIRRQSGAKITGEIKLSGQDILKLPEEELRRRVGLVFQQPSPFPFSIMKNMTYAPKYYGISDRKKLEAIAVEKLQMAGLYDEVKDELNKSALKLSGGQQQRLCIARALTVEPEVMLLDEPCSALDVRSSAVIEDMLARLKESYTIVIVTHNISQARRLSDQTVFLLGGKLIEAGPTDRLFEDPQAEETRSFLAGAY